MRGLWKDIDGWLITSRLADILGIVAFAISVCTLIITRGIRKSMLAHIESSDYRKAIDQQISELEAYRTILIERSVQEPHNIFFTKLTVILEDISIAYETILPKRVLKATSRLIELIRNKMNSADGYKNKQNVDKCISLLGYVVAELKKEKEII